MEYTFLGRTGMRVSRLCLGTMNFGVDTEEAEAFRIMDAALDAGITFLIRRIFTAGVKMRARPRLLLENGSPRAEDAESGSCWRPKYMSDLQSAGRAK